MLQPQNLSKEKNSDPHSELFVSRTDVIGNKTSGVLLKVLDETPIGEGFYASVSKISVDFKGKTLSFAKKTFKNPDKTAQNAEFQHSLEIRNRIKNAGLPTWTTYRAIQGQNQILMTLGTRGSDLLISPHNLSNQQKTALQEQKTNFLPDKERFFQESFSLLQKATDSALTLARDSYFLKKHNDQTSLLIGDFDQIGTRKNAKNKDLILSSNIEQFGLFLLEIEKNLKIRTYSDFFSFLLQKQNEGLINPKINLKNIKAKVQYQMG